ncbi:MAG: hypothetical protein KGJ62_07115 [Armatimonadetes bacterium]|nr:hypothetical protein [Armatimonadota bacterium]MDE2207296.1 hypothetical protein [Armatimonadota bacterium]
MYPWHSASATELWNPLRWDSVAQFYPWRLFAARTLHTGFVPLWNPYQFCGTPFLANSQSAVFYPLNALFWILHTAAAFNASALVHLALCGWFTWLLARRGGCSFAAAFTAGTVMAFGAWEVQWLQLPTFLETSCWIPLILAAMLAVYQRRGSFWLHGACIAAGTGCMLLAGHLQIAFYGFLAGGLWLMALMVRAARDTNPRRCLALAAAVVGFASVGALLGMCQVLPGMELARLSHRTAPATGVGYQAYSEYALQPGELIGAFLPQFFGSDTNRSWPYWGFYQQSIAPGVSLPVRHNAAETAIYVGVAPLLLAGFGILAMLRRHHARWLAAGASLLSGTALLMALGTPINRLFYFVVPGFSSTGSPARVLVIFTLGIALLAAVGVDAVAERQPTRREMLLVFGGAVLALCVALRLTVGELAMRPQGAPSLAQAIGHTGADWLAVAVAVIAVLGATLFSSRHPARAPMAVAVLVVLELMRAGWGINPTSPARAVYPVTDSIRYLQQHAGHSRVWPVNQQWSLYQTPPAVLPPNACTVYGLRDVQGYDSLFSGLYKHAADTAALPNRAGLRDSSPAEVGNMVFIQDPASALGRQMAVRWMVRLPANAEGSALPSVGTTPALSAQGEMSIYHVDGLPRASVCVTDRGPAVAGARCTWLKDAATRVDLSVSTPQQAVLILRDARFPGWRAMVDGRRQRIEPAGPDGIFRMVAVPAGVHNVRFAYQPASYRLGLYLSGLAFALISFFSSCGIGSYRRSNYHAAG